MRKSGAKPAGNAMRNYMKSIPRGTKHIHTGVTEDQTCIRVRYECVDGAVVEKTFPRSK
jgi:hypothetical protein